MTETLYTNTAGSKALEALVKKYREKGYSLVTIESTSIENGTLQVTISSGKAGSIEIARTKTSPESLQSNGK